MSGALLLGLDIGTTSTKGVLLDLDRGVVAERRLPVELHSPRIGHAEVEAADWWANVCLLPAALLAAAGVDAGAVAGVAVTGMVPAVLPVDRAGEPLTRAMLQNDARASVEIRELAAELAGTDLVARTGSPLSQQSVAPTLRWLARHLPQVRAGTATLAGSYDWVARRLGAEPHLERNWALESGLFELDGTPCAPVLAAADVDPALLPPVAEPGRVVGAVSASAATETGLRAGTPIVVGGADHVLSAVASGLRRPGDWTVKLGGGGDILAVSDFPLVDRRLYLDAHPVPGLWLPNGCMATSGSLVRWLAALTGVDDLAALGAEAAARRPGEVLCLPYFLGEKSPWHDTDLRGAFVGLDLAHDRASLYRAVLEAVAFGFRHHVEILTECGIALAETPVVTNGGAGSALWKQIHADVLDRPVVALSGHPGGALGAAQAAAVGVGLVPGWAEMPLYVRPEAPVLPDPASAARLAEAYRTWRALGEVLAPISHRLARS
ncbi:FGGY family carbohydrate kinase [Pseudonocardia sp. WMMC193]|uniref:FGGY family carbohydrate kinase n=1 Tax=Pseudonocardia sp. WMMC193 TaxID=2911965 RepID=UPI001EFF126D|nr:FGGY family carbohydrate kinase [Pseudonocardia sp. WMMC193]MCF7548216.1 hypothetical protein [Pseudonocardia sp. WMMC193]